MLPKGALLIQMGTACITETQLIFAARSNTLRLFLKSGLDRFETLSSVFGRYSKGMTAHMDPSGS